MKILFLSRWFPYPPNNGSKLRIYNLLRGLAQRHTVTLLSFTEATQQAPDLSGLTNLCAEVQAIPWKPFAPQSQRALLGFFSSTPRAYVDMFSNEMQAAIAAQLTNHHYDAIVASQVDMAAYSQYFRGIPALFEEAEVGVLYEKFVQAKRVRQRLRAGLTWLKHRRYLATLLRNFQACTVVSDQEKQLMRRAVAGSQTIEVVPNGVDLASYGKRGHELQPNTLIFTGSFNYVPNHEAMVWFTGQVLPRIQAEVPDAQLVVTGDTGGRTLPEAKHVTLTGFVDDVRALVARSWVSVAPIHTGGGTRLKILEAMALGTPVVATAKGAEGLDVQPGTHLLVANSAEEFAQMVLRLLKEPDLRHQLVENAYQLVSTRYDWSVLMPRFLNVVEGIAR
jgi:sugar transferase (PEP-CTERM/EpsH1 system associated)